LSGPRFGSKSFDVIVDEASASVDSRTDALIRDILMDECRNLTVLIIAHKSQTVSRCAASNLVSVRDESDENISALKVENSLERGISPYSAQEFFSFLIK